MRTLAIGDIHGCSKALDHLLEIVNPKPQDTLITLGDYVNKGRDSKGVIDRLISLHKQGNLIPLKGNHEIIMLQARHNPLKQRLWLQKGGKATLKSYSEGHLIKIPESHWDFLGKVCINSYETANHLFVHASLDPHLPLARQPEYKLFWEKFQYPAAHSSGKTMICGHTSQKSGKPINLGHAICIDTWAYGQGWLSCLDVERGKLWQTNQRGNFRISHIQDYYRSSSLGQDIKDGSPIFGGSLLSRAAAITFKGK